MLDSAAFSGANTCHQQMEFTPLSWRGCSCHHVIKVSYLAERHQIQIFPTQIQTLQLNSDSTDPQTEIYIFLNIISAKLDDFI